VSRDERIDNPDINAYARMNAQDMYRMLTGADPTDLREMVRIVGGNQAAADITGRDIRTVQRWVTTAGERISRPRADAFEALRAAAEQARTGLGDVQQMVQLVGGNQAAADITGRDIRTVQRWVTNTGRRSRPRGDALQALRAAAQRTARRQVLTTGRERRLRNQGMRMRGPAYAGPLISDVEYRRRRYFDHSVPGSVMDRTIDAYLAGGEEDAYIAFNGAFGAEYELTGHDPGTVSWIIEDMSGLDFTIRRGED
jgi:transposase-like protein